MNAEAIIDKMEALKSARCELNAKLEQVAEFACPEKSGHFFSVEVPEGHERSRRVVIDNVSEANSVLARGLYSNLCTPGVQTFQFRAADKELMKVQENKEFFGRASAEYFSIIGGSNFSQEVNEAFEDVGWAGIMNTSVEEDPVRFVKFMTYHISEYYVEENADKLIDTVYREFMLTARQLVGAYTLDTDAIPQEIREKAQSDRHADHGKKYTVIHAVFPNSDYKLGADGEPILDNRNKRFRSMTVVRDLKAIIRDSGFDHLPYTVGRFEKKSKSVYGFSPGLRMLRTAHLLNDAMRTIIRAAQVQADPPRVLDMAAYQPVNGAAGIPAVYYSHPGATNYYNSKGGKPPEFAQVPSNLAVGDALTQKWEHAIDEAHLVTLFQMLQQLAENKNQQRTAFEIMQLVSERHALVIPVVARILDEYLQGLYLKGFYICLRRGCFGEVPRGLVFGDQIAPVEVVFTSPLAIAARQSQIKVFEDALAQVGQLAQFDGGAGLDYFNFDKFVEFLLEAGGVNPDFVRSRTEVEEIRADRAAQQQQQMQQQQLAELAKSQNLNQAPEAGSVANSAMEGLVQL